MNHSPAIPQTDVLYDARWFGNHGIGRFATEIFRSVSGLTPFQENRRPVHPLDPWLLGAALRGTQPGLFFSPGYNSPIGWRGRYVFTLHDLNHLCVPGNSNALKRAYYQHIIRPACHRAQFVLTVSEYSRGEIAQWAEISPERIVNVGNGVGPPFTADGARYEPGYPYFLYVGSHKPHKNLPRLLQAYARSGLQKDSRLLITGSPEKALLETIQELRLRDSIVFLPSPQNDDLAALYRGALALIFPSLYEGFGLPPLEAMACGIPVLTSNICSLPEIAGDAGLLVDPKSAEAIAEGMRILAHDECLRQNLRRKGLQRASEYTWEKTAAKTARILDAARL